MDVTTATEKYLNSEATVCSYCNEKIITRSPLPNELITRLPAGYRGLRITVAECGNGHFWIELYDEGELRTAWGRLVVNE